MAFVPSITSLSDIPKLYSRMRYLLMSTEDPRILELRRVRAKALEGGGAEKTKKQKAKGKLTARERIDLLLDPGTFNEIEPFITHLEDELNYSSAGSGSDLWNLRGSLIMKTRIPSMTAICGITPEYCALRLNISA